MEAPLISDCHTHDVLGLVHKLYVEWTGTNNATHRANYKH